MSFCCPVKYKVSDLTRTLGKTVAVFLITLPLIACNSLFYQPDKLNYSLPQEISPSFEEFRVPVGSQTETLHVWSFRPKTAPLGTILHFHGNAQNMSSHVWFVAWLVDAGYEVVTFDYRGYGASTGSATRQNTVEDGEAMIRWLAKRQSTEPFVIVAQSLGGAIAYSALAKLNGPNPVRALIIESSFSSYRRLARLKLASFFLTWPLQWPLSYLVDDDLSPESLAWQNPVSILFIHGTADRVVPYSAGVDFSELAKRHKNNVSFYTDPKRGHTSCFASAQLSPCKERVLGFLNDNLQVHKKKNTQERTSGQ